MPATDWPGCVEQCSSGSCSYLLLHKHKGRSSVCLIGCAYVLLLTAALLQGRMRKDMARLEAQRQELSDRINSLQASIFKGSEKLDQVGQHTPYRTHRPSLG